MNNRKSIWKPELYRIQLEAPKPKSVNCECLVETPSYYGSEYHGVMGHKDAGLLLEHERNGSFLIRKGCRDNDFYTLSLRFNDKIHHYKLYYDGKHYLREKRYDNVYEMVADGLVIMHMELKAKHILDIMHSNTSYTESPYVMLNRKKLQQLTDQQLDPIHSNKQGIINESFIHEEQDQETKNHPITDSTVEKPRKYSKPHTFRMHNFKGLNWCEMCANFLWGFTAQGVKCEDCGFIAHLKCSESVPYDCLPDLKRIRGVFGIDLTTLLNAHSSTLPFVVRKCILEVEQRGLTVEGIYRISGFADEMETLKLAFDRDGESTDLSTYSINVIAGTLKLYLRLLPVPLITYDMHPLILNAINSKNDCLESIRTCLLSLPPAHYNCLQYVIKHLNKVTGLSDQNKMSAYNLSTVFTPTLIAIPPTISDLTLEIRALQYIIENCHIVFHSKS